MGYRSELESRLAKKDDQGDRRPPHDRGRRPRHGRPVGRQGQLGAAADPRRAAPARADPTSRSSPSTSTPATRTTSTTSSPSTCEARGWEYRIEHTAIGEVIDDILDADDTPCSLCARLRRGVLYRIAKEVGATKIALGHHADDFIETLLLNLFFAGALKAMPAKLVSDDGAACRDSAAGLRRRGRGARSTRRNASCRSSAAAVRRAATWASSGSGSSG